MDDGGTRRPLKASSGNGRCARLASATVETRWVRRGASTSAEWYAVAICRRVTPREARSSTTRSGPSAWRSKGETIMLHSAMCVLPVEQSDEGEGRLEVVHAVSWLTGTARTPRRHNGPRAAVDAD